MWCRRERGRERVTMGYILPGQLEVSGYLDDEEQLVFVLVVMPHELALQLGHLHIEIVHLTWRIKKSRSLL
jgi:hypothetical protein